MQKNNQQNPQQGLVISYFGNSVAVEAEDGQVFQCHLRRNQELPVVGDSVTWQLEPSGTGIIHEINPRRSVLGRGDNRGKMKPIAANLDAIVIVMVPPPIFAEHLVNRYIVAAELLKLEPILVVNKADLLDQAAQEALIERLKPYRDIPYPIHLSFYFCQS